MAFNLEQQVQTSNAFINELSATLKASEEQTERMVRDALHTLRDVISIGESLDLIAQFPLFLKAVYVNGWSGAVKSKIDTMDQFMARLAEQGANNRSDFADNRESARQQVEVIYNFLGKYLSEGQAQDVIANLPADLKPLFAGVK